VAGSEQARLIDYLSIVHFMLDVFVGFVHSLLLKCLFEHR
jgi:hypothetical protein